MLCDSQHRRELLPHARRCIQPVLNFNVVSCNFTLPCSAVPNLQRIFNLTSMARTLTGASLPRPPGTPRHTPTLKCKVASLVLARQCRLREDSFPTKDETCFASLAQRPKVLRHSLSGAPRLQNRSACESGRRKRVSLFANSTRNNLKLVIVVNLALHRIFASNVLSVTNIATPANGNLSGLENLGA